MTTDTPRCQTFTAIRILIRQDTSPRQGPEQSVFRALEGLVPPARTRLSCRHLNREKELDEMIRLHLLLPAIATSLVAPALAQVTPPPTPANAPSQFIPGLDIQARINNSFNDYQQGSITAVSMSTTACNPGSVIGTWEAAPDEDHPFICQMYCRLSNGRFEQINNWSHVKHSFGSTNSNECGLGCQGGASFSQLGLNCSDTYGAGLNASRSDLGPAHEVNPFTGEWEMTGSYFDRGDPDQGFPQNQDGNPSPLNVSGAVTNRCQIPHSKIGTPGATYYAMAYYIHKWEPESNRTNNMSSYQLNLTTTSATGTGAIAYGSVLSTRYTNARVESQANFDGNGVARDGRFYVGVRVINNQDGTYRYEYAVHNRDNHGRNAEFRVPICPTGTASDFGMKGVNEAGEITNWTAQRVGDELVFSAPDADSQQPWNTIYNFWFEADAGPGNGQVEIMEGLVSPGANASVMVASDVPTSNRNIDLGGSCNANSPELTTNGDATLPNQIFQLLSDNNAPFAQTAFHVNFNGNSVPFGGCEVLTPTFSIPSISLFNGLSGVVLALPNDPNLEGVSMFVQAVEGQAGGPILNVADLSNIMEIRIGNNVTGC